MEETTDVGDSRCRNADGDRQMEERWRQQMEERWRQQMEERWRQQMEEC